jgi:hypothetical protein
MGKNDADCEKNDEDTAKSYCQRPMMRMIPPSEHQISCSGVSAENTEPVAVEVLNCGQDLVVVYNDATRPIYLRFIAGPSVRAVIENAVPLLVIQ